MWTLSFEIPATVSEHISQWLMDIGSMGASIEDIGQAPVFDQGGHFERCLIHGFFDEKPPATLLEIPLQLLLQSLGIQSMPTLLWQEQQEQDWQNAWKENFHPIEVGQRLLILPSWLEEPAHNQRIVLRIDPQQAFGTGGHETTFGCLEQLDRLSLQQTPVSMLDLGTGSGILAIAARKLGIPHVIATDNDPIAVATAQENGRLNGIVSGLEVRLCDTVPQDVTAQLITANILAPVIQAMLKQGLKGCLQPKGTLLLSGILAGEQAQTIRMACQQHQLMVQEPIHIYGDWVVMRAQHTMN
ncbi:[LSU ribosomal protein L11P]-lysine N-methyltransferase [Magnetococcus marinus MC-1]|uniref:Ribosomal protein L11 methyltransferase n=1 Tax=Magnetococcus marinus (strain ATCC BAA-1437 / JCM 17883 / MC-1) TaxID=156889 RepID=A0L908_MAGMM|nr:50S ribosomal protein L11 methyltransferase [Magnetococcus marinus]ABK44451.1 [LSU ribosomal protein L11P]-lysine N-methyltransferase [Magnetococcus marinus MC-1]